MLADVSAQQQRELADRRSEVPALADTAEVAYRDVRELSTELESRPGSVDAVVAEDNADLLMGQRGYSLYGNEPAYLALECEVDSDIER